MVSGIIYTDFHSKIIKTLGARQMGSTTPISNFFFLSHWALGELISRGFRLGRLGTRIFFASFIKFCPEKVHQDSPCPRSLTLESWRTGWFLRPLKLLLICSKMFSELFLQVSSSFTIEKSIKTLYVL